MGVRVFAAYGEVTHYDSLKMKFGAKWAWENRLRSSEMGGFVSGDLSGLEMIERAALDEYIMGRCGGRWPDALQGEKYESYIGRIVAEAMDDNQWELESNGNPNYFLEKVLTGETQGV